MSIGSALQTGVNGLRAQATKLATISDNIANSSTVGYKRSEAQFSTLVVNSGSSTSYTAGGVTTSIRQEVSTSGTILASDTITDLAVAGTGFFAVAQQENGNGTALTRAGSFRADENGNLQNAGGYFLQGFALNPDGSYTNGAPSLTTFDSLETVNLATIQGTARPTTSVEYSGNIPADTGTLAAPVEFQASIQYFDDLGATGTLTLNWTQAVPGSNIWDVEIYDGTVATGTLITTLDTVDFSGAAVGINPGSPDYNGGTTAAPATYNVAGFDPVTGTLSIEIPGPAGPASQAIDIVLGPEGGLAGATQFGGDFTPQTITDGSALGQLQQVDIEDNGTLVAIFDNGEIRPVFQIPLADVINPEGLNAVDGNAYTLSADSGDLRIAVAGGNNIGSISAGALEGANVDVAEELTTLIETQRAYSSNATVVQTADEMLEEITRIGR